MATNDIILLQKNGSATWAEVILAAVNDGYLGFNGSGQLVVKTAPPVAAHASTHLAGGTDALAWTTIHASGVIGSRPAAAATNAGYFYFATDEDGGTLYRSDGSSWAKWTTGLTGALKYANDADITDSNSRLLFSNGDILGDENGNIFGDISGTDGVSTDIQDAIEAERDIVTNSTPTTGQTVSSGVLGLNETLYITPAGTLAALTVGLPASGDARVGQVVSGFITQIITTFTVNTAGGGVVIGTTPDTSAANSSFAYRCVSVSGAGTWIKIYSVLS